MLPRIMLRFVLVRKILNFGKKIPKIYATAGVNFSVLNSLIVIL